MGSWRDSLMTPPSRCRAQGGGERSCRHLYWQAGGERTPVHAMPHAANPSCSAPSMLCAGRTARRRRPWAPPPPPCKPSCACGSSASSASTRYGAAGQDVPALLPPLLLLPLHAVPAARWLSVPSSCLEPCCPPRHPASPLQVQDTPPFPGRGGPYGSGQLGLHARGSGPLGGSRGEQDEEYEEDSWLVDGERSYSWLGGPHAMPCAPAVRATSPRPLPGGAVAQCRSRRWCPTKESIPPAPHPHETLFPQSRRWPARRPSRTTRPAQPAAGTRVSAALGLTEH